MINELKSLIKKPSRHHHICEQPFCDDTVPDEFSILCWNVHKNNDNFSFKHYIEEFTKTHPVDFFIFQEADFKHEKELNLEAFSYTAAANLEKNKSFYGVLTASKCKTSHSRPLISKGKELVVGPKKSLLLTKHQFKDQSPLWILNLHAINFRENKHFYKEIDHIEEIIEQYQGALIIAGDFNTWNKRRTSYLFDKMKELKLTNVPFTKEDKVKSFMRNHLDFIFYRGLELEYKHIENNHNLSDHHPLYAKFTKK